MAKLADKAGDLNPIIRKLEEAKSTGPDGKIAYRGMRFGDLAIVLEGSIEFSVDVPERERSSIITKALFSPAAAKPLTQRSIMAEIGRLENAYLKTEPTTFIIATSLSLPTALRVRRTRFNGVGVTFSASLPKQYKREQYERGFRVNSHNPFPTGYQSVRLRIQTRSKSEAIDKAIDALDFIRGLWNFGINRRIAYQFPVAVRTPVNRIRLGQVHTIHFANGQPADESYLYEASFVLNNNPEFVVGNSWTNAKKDEQQIRPLINKSPYSAALVSAVLRYCRALDSLDYESAHIKLWSLLEFLTGSVDGKTEEVINRCLFLYQERDFHRQVLNHLRNRRHGFVHSAEQSVNAMDLVFLTKFYVENLLLFHFRNTGRFATMQDAASFLNLPFNTDVLRERINRLKMALKFRSG